jgi:hypothetical protein
MSKASLELGGGNWAAKDGKLLGYAVGDTSGKYLPREFTFSRGADIAATRVNKDGLIEKYRENLLTYSNQFDTTWTTTNISLTSGQSGHDGSNDAWLAQGNGLGTSRLQHGGLDWSNSVYTLSFYAKAGTESVVNVFDGTWSGVIGATYDLSTGTATQYPISIPVVEVTMVSVGNGWWRCSFTAIPNERTNTPGFVRIGIGSTTAANSGNIYIQDAQLEYGLVATDYLESGSTTGKAGVLDNLPRIDYTGGSASLLLEPQRANLVTQSEAFETGWSLYTYSGGDLVRTFGYESPAGTNDAYKFDVTVGTGGILLTQNINVTASVDYTLSVWLKGDRGGEKVQIDLKNGGSQGPSGALFTLTTEWKRYDVSVTNDAGTSRGFQFRCTISQTTSDQTFYVWGAQLEEGSYPTSYIPTYGASVTRNADSCVATSVSDLIGQTEGTLFAEVDVTSFKEGLTSDIILSAYTNTANRIMMSLDGIGTKRAVVFIRSNSTSYDYSTDKNFSLGTNKLAFSYGENYRALYLNGEKISEDTSTFPVPPIANLGIGRRDDNSGQFGDGVKQTLIFNTRLTDSECIALTTL